MEDEAVSDPVSPPGGDCRPSSPAAASTDGRQFEPRWPRLRRLVFFLLVVVSSLLAAVAMAQILSANGFQIIEMAIFALFTINFVWIAATFWSATAGFLIQAFKLDPISLRPRSRLSGGACPLTTRTAIIMPIYNEESERVFAGIETVYRSLEATGHLSHFDIFVLSDSTRDDVAARERQCWEETRQRLNAHSGTGGRLFYRRRQPNVGRKAGNVADFCRTFGAAYETMVVLDADSIMTGQTIVELVRLMEANPSVGLVQTLAMPVNQTTAFGRFLQFAGRLYAPVLASGLGFWQLDESNYWGHNAIIRIRAFAANCGLPKVPGKPPLGGEILSHDFVEAALLRRGGWFVYAVPELGGSWEELPGNIIDYATRDRRWCQGNLQHLKLLTVKGLHPLSRLHFLHGAFAYLASPLWFAFLLLSTAAIVEQAIVGHDYFPEGRQLFPAWPISKWVETISLFAITFALLLAPRFYSLALASFNRTMRRGFGGTARLMASAAIELIFSMLIAPVMMGLHSYFVTCLLLGKGVSWNPQNRAERGLRVGEAFSYLGVLFVGGLAWGLLIIEAAPNYFWWIMPVLAGLVLSIPVSVLSSRGSVGRWFRHRGLLLTPEETMPPEEVSRVNALCADARTNDAEADVVAMDGLPATPEPAPLAMEPQTFQRLRLLSLLSLSAPHRPAT